MELINLLGIALLALLKLLVMEPVLRRHAPSQH